MKQSLTCAVVLAAVSAGLTMAIGCSDPTPARPRAFIASSVKPGAAGMQKCGLSAGLPPGDPYVAIGDVNHSIEDGSQFNGATVSVSCSVTRAGDGFNVQGQAFVPGTEGGSIAISGYVTASGTQNGIKGVFQKTGASFNQSDCTVSYPDPVMGVFSGRIWAVLSCPRAADVSQGRECEGSATFRFENCTQ